MTDTENVIVAPNPTNMRKVDTKSCEEKGNVGVEKASTIGIK